MTSAPFFLTDVFTHRAYGGNQLATLLDVAHLSTTEMQQIAREINFSETTFITGRDAVDGAYNVRIFTPQAEVEFAGHPTLGTAHVIRHQLCAEAPKQLTLRLPVGLIDVRFDDQAAGDTVVWMKQASPSFGPQAAPADMAPVLGLRREDLHPTWPVQELSTGFPHWVVPVRDLATLRRVQLHLPAYQHWISTSRAKLILAFCTEGFAPGQDLSVRVFAPYYGIAEDAATGSGNGCLAAYLLQHRCLGPAPKLRACSGQGDDMGRPSTLYLEAEINDSSMTVCVGGQVVDVAQGQWWVPDNRHPTGQDGGAKSC